MIIVEVNFNFVLTQTKAGFIHDNCVLEEWQYSARRFTKLTILLFSEFIERFVITNQSVLQKFSASKQW